MEDERFCRICYCDADPFSDTHELISPCDCKCSVKYVHKNCLQYWRFKGKRLILVKFCEQCTGKYTVDGEKQLEGSALCFLTTLFILVTFIASSFLVNIVIRAFKVVIDDLVQPEIINIDYGSRDSFVEKIASEIKYQPTFVKYEDTEPKYTFPSADFESQVCARYFNNAFVCNWFRNLITNYHFGQIIFNFSSMIYVTVTLSIYKLYIEKETLSSFNYIFTLESM